MRTDPYQQRARELAIAAGVDPDARIPMDGKPGRSTPAWCSFRQAARDEHVAAEAAKLGVELPPQAERFQGSPLKILGDHDDGTVAQMRNCMGVGNVVAGVICADGHLGYAQPVGGVVAYEDQISISGVGFDIACFTGDTLVYTLDGKHHPIKKLVGQSIVVPACNPDGDVIAANAVAVLTKENSSLMRITLDNGEAIRCTPTQKFMLRNGDFTEAHALAAGQSLMPFRLYTDKDGYVMIRDNKRRVPVNAAWIVAKSGLLGEIPKYEGDKTIIHHDDRDRANNTPSNLGFMSKKDHDALHAPERDWSHIKTPEYEANCIAAIKAFWVEARKENEFMQRRAETARSNLRRGQEDKPEAFTKNNAEAGVRGKKFLVKYNKSDLAKQNAAKRAEKGKVCAVCGVRVGSTSTLAAHMRKGHTEWVADNHKIASVERLNERADVYCLVVPGVNTFALSAGVFVHNCGNMAVRLDTPFEAIAPNVLTITRDIAKTISFGIGRTNEDRVSHELFDDGDAWRESGMEDYRQKAMAQLGTVGSGNHYVDLMRDGDGFVWIGVHFGSRGLGHTSATRYLKLAGGKDGINVPPAVVDDSSEVGVRYLAAMHLAGRYAYAGREWVVDRVRQIIGGNVMDTVHNHHNFAWKESVNGRDHWVVRKGATPAFPGQRGFVGGSMGDDAVIIEGVESEASRAALYSTVHGAGRLFGRKEAKRRFQRADMDAWLRERGVTLMGADLDESPMAYRRLPEVLAHHTGTINVLHTLRPFAVVMAGEGELDPWKD